ncbi:hypothetical protein GTA08_BOTSDO01124 [Neofusicoccum parvum]|nr:hypothetical protein GTA08_BOTSDO01124 [Neofusicoccum parvum]
MDDDLILDPGARDVAGDVRGGAPTTADDHGADFQLPLPPLSASDEALLRAVAARAEAAAAGGKPPLRRLIAAYDAEAAAQGIQRGLAPVYQGYLLRMADGVGVDELLGSGVSDRGERGGKRRSGKL